MESLVKKAKSGDREALEAVVLSVKDLVYNLSLKMLLFPEDAKDATQEILIRIITHLGTFEHESRFTTWVYRISVNYLLNHKGKRSREFSMPFEAYEELIDSGQSNTVRHASNQGELALLEEEVKISCTQGLLLCLSPIDRMVYVLSEILDFSGKEGAAVMEISYGNFRQKLSRSRRKIKNFLEKKCGLANPANPCRCTKKIDFLTDQGIIDPAKLRFAHLSSRSIDLISQLEDLERSVAIYRSTPNFGVPEQVVEKIRRILKIDG